MPLIVKQPGKTPYLSGVTAQETMLGIVDVTIRVAAYEEAGEHWKRVLSGPRHGGYGRIFIQRYGINRRRYLNCYDWRGMYRGQPANIDECPGAMFIWQGKKEASTEPVFAHNNQRLGRDMGWALRPFQQTGETDFWEVRFKFV
ncbi:MULTISPECIES: hypothetical protein [Bosea]|jgi:hypothetical protein|uniref:hypothetical protein n=1 Tax=Bosea TaxID=85413 RepID=UPI0006BA8BFD|nr:hypothetical protein [Bosea vaviloviae]